MYESLYNMTKQELDESIFSWEWPDALGYTDDETIYDSTISASGIRRSDVDSASNSPGCNHHWVNISFSGLHLACKHCGVDKCE